MTHFADDDARRPALDPGTRVEVRTGFDRSWTDGFEVESITAGGYRVRRRTDARVLPTTFTEDSIRQERKTSMWWF